MRNKLFIIVFFFPLLATGQKYDTVRLGLSTAVHLIFESQIVKAHIGLGEMIGADGKPYKDILTEVDSVDRMRLTMTAAVENFETTNLFVETKTAYFNLILMYSKWPTKHIKPVLDTEAAYPKRIKVTPEDIKQSQIKKIEQQKNDTLRELANLALKKKFIEPDIGERKLKMIVYLNGIYVDERYMYFRVTMKNEGSIPFEIGQEVAKVVDSDTKGVKDRKAVEAPLPKIPVHILNEELKEINKGQEISKVFVFEKFTIAHKRKFVIDLWEKSPGQRIFQLKIPSSELLKAERL